LDKEKLGAAWFSNNSSEQLFVVNYRVGKSQQEIGYRKYVHSVEKDYLPALRILCKQTFNAGPENASGGFTTDQLLRPKLRKTPPPRKISSKVLQRLERIEPAAL
jgi:hypothetical protein